MKQTTTPPTPADSSGDRSEVDVPQVLVRPRRGLSLVWMIPILTAIIGAVLVYRTLENRGVTITIEFKSAEGLEPGKTRVKFNAVEVGLIESVQLTPDLSAIAVTATLEKYMQPHLTDSTRFWVERPRIGTAGISGLGTIVSGTFVAMDTGEGDAETHFEGMEAPPHDEQGQKSLSLVLVADRLGSISEGSPILFRDVEAGKVGTYRIRSDGRVKIDAFIHEKYVTWVRTTSRFWNASGFDLSVTTDGVKLDAESLATVAFGGVAFDTDLEDYGNPCVAGSTFEVFDSRDTAFARHNGKVLTYRLDFDDSVRGLSPGAPVQYQGIQIGEVEKIWMEVDRDLLTIRTPVRMSIELDRAQILSTGELDDATLIERLVAKKGLRARLATGSLVTGKLYVALDHDPDPDSRGQIVRDGEDLRFPTIPSQLRNFTSDVMAAVQQIRGLSLEELAENATSVLGRIDSILVEAEQKQTVTTLTDTLSRLGDAASGLVGKADTAVSGIQRTTTSLNVTLEQAAALLTELHGALGDDSPTRHELDRLLVEMQAASRSVRALADYLGRHPDAVLYGKSSSGGGE